MISSARARLRRSNRPAPGRSWTHATLALITTLALSLAVIAGVQLTPAVAAGISAGATIELSQSEGPAGTPVGIRAHGLGSTSELSVVWDASHDGMPTAPKAKGSFQMTFIVPQATAGSHEVAVVDTAAGVIASARFVVVESAPEPTASATLSVSGTGSTPAPSAPVASLPAASPAPSSTDVARAGAATVTWAIIGNDGTHLATERSAGLTTKVFELGWSSYEPSNGVFDSGYIAAKRTEAASLRAAGFSLILSFGVQYAPSWVMSLPNSSFVDQNGAVYDDRSSGSGRANFVWNDDLRALQARYIARVFADLGTDWAAVRIGGGRFGELGYPVATYGLETNTYWAFDANASATNPVPGWIPGAPSPNGEAQRFADWYMDRLAGYVAWQARTVRASFGGRIMVLFPSFGVRPGQLNAAIAGNLSGATSAEKNGEVQRGYDVARQVLALAGQSGIVLTTTWLDCPFGSDTSSRPVDWRPVHYLASLAAQNGMATYGENTGRGSASVLSFTASQARTYGLLGFAWFNEQEVLGGSYATLADLAALIARG